MSAYRHTNMEILQGFWDRSTFDYELSCGQAKWKIMSCKICDIPDKKKCIFINKDFKYIKKHMKLNFRALQTGRFSILCSNTFSDVS